MDWWVITRDAQKRAVAVGPCGDEEGAEYVAGTMVSLSRGFVVVQGRAAGMRHVDPEDYVEDIPEEG